MRKIVPFIALCLAAFTATIDAPQVVTLEGTFIDTKCYGMSDKNSGNNHMLPGADGKMMEVPNCASACSMTGIPTGLLQKNGDVVIMVTPTTQLSAYMAQEARVTGKKVFGGGIMPDKIEVKDGRSWKEVKITTMM